MIVCELQCQHALRGSSLRKNQADAGSVAARVPVGRVVHLKNQIGAGRDELCHRVRQVVWRTPRRVDQQNIAIRPIRAATIIGIAQRGGGERHAHRRVLHPFRIRRPHVHHSVMHVRAKQRKNLHRPHPAVLLESTRHNLVRVFNVAARRNWHSRRHFQNQVRLRYAPAHRPTPRPRRVARIPGGRAGFCPSCERRNLSRRKRRIIRKVPDARIGKPRRHRFVPRRRRNRRCVWPRLLIGSELHRCYALGTMANLAAFLQNRQHVAVKRWRARYGRLPCGGGCRCQRSLGIESACESKSNRRKKHTAPLSKCIKFGHHQGSMIRASARFPTVLLT